MDLVNKYLKLSEAWPGTPEWKKKHDPNYNPYDPEGKQRQALKVGPYGSRGKPAEGEGEETPTAQPAMKKRGRPKKVREEHELDEISDKTKLSWRKKAVASVGDMAGSAADAYYMGDKEKSNKLMSKATKRYDRTQKLNSLAFGTKKEEVEQVDEISATTHAKYRLAARQDIRTQSKNLDTDSKASDRIQKRIGGLARSTGLEMAKNKTVKEESYKDSVPASKALQKAHDDERKRRGLPDPSYYLELMKKKRQEIEDMKKESVDSPPFTPDKPKKQSVVPGKYGREYSMARHLARSGIQAALKDLKKGKEKGKTQVEGVQLSEEMSHSELADHHFNMAKKYYKKSDEYENRGNSVDADHFGEVAWKHAEAHYAHKEAAESKDPEKSKEAHEASRVANSYDVSESVFKEATGDKAFNSMMNKIKRGVNKQAAADVKERRKAREAATKEWARNALGPSPADKLSIRKEEVEQVDELSKTTLASYTKKATRNAAVRNAIATNDERNEIDPNSSLAQQRAAKSLKDYNRSKVTNRLAGVNKAVDRLTREEVEQVDELSKTTLASYTKKAAKDSRLSQSLADRYKKDRSRDPIKKMVAGNLAKEFQKKAWKREDGVNKAVDRLAKEEVEQVDELSKDTLKSYADKSMKDADTRRKQGGAYEKLAPSDPAHARTLYAKAAKRLAGSTKAMSRLAKEEVELNEVKVGDKVNFDHEMTAAPGRTTKKSGTVEKIEGDIAHVKTKDKYGVMRYKKNVGELRKEEVEQVSELKTSTIQSYMQKRTSDVKGRMATAIRDIESGFKTNRSKAQVKSLRTAQDRLDKERKKQTAMNPPRPRPAPEPTPIGSRFD